jgi:hypothetical protein
MNFKEKIHQPAAPVIQSEIGILTVTPPASSPPADGPAAPDGPSILINCGIHSGSYPVVGMSVADTRDLLGGIMNIDPSAIAVIRGQRIEDERGRRISAVDGILSFVKESSLKGAGGAAGRAAGRRP